MVSEKIVNLLVMILSEIVMSTIIFWKQRRLNPKVLSDAITIWLNHIGFTLIGYFILGSLGPAFPRQFTSWELVFIAAGIVSVCLVLGYVLNLLLSRINGWDSRDARGQKRHNSQR